MILPIEDVTQLDEYEGADPKAVKRKLLGIESAIRAYTNNNFTVRGARITAPAVSGKLMGASPYIKAGDRVQVSRSGHIHPDGYLVPVGMNDGLYDVVGVSGGITELDSKLYDLEVNELFLVRYPEAIKAGVLELMRWDATGRDKVGVASESISRHSVSYYQFSDAEMLMGYPASMMGFLKPYVRARF